MEIIKNEFQVVDYIVIGLGIVSLLFGLWAIPSVIVYLISRKVDNKGFKIVSYIAVILLLLSSAGWRLQVQLMNFLIESSIFSFGSDYSLYPSIVHSIIFILPFVGYLLMLLFYISSKRNNVVFVSLIIVVLGNLFVVLYNILTSYYNSVYEMVMIPYQVYLISNLEPYLMMLVLLILYKEVLFPSKNKEQKELYERHEETV